MMNLRSAANAVRALRLGGGGGGRTLLGGGGGGLRPFSNALKYEPNKVSKLPKFEPKDNASNDINWEKHNTKEWSTPMVSEAIDKHSVFPWIGNKALQSNCINVVNSSDIYLHDREGKKYMDWSSGAVCANLGHTIPEEIVEAMVE
jgi:hypothetical protein